MRLPGTVKWIGLALLGLVIAGGVAFAASRLASQQIGIASESISAGDTLAPSAVPREGGKGGEQGKTGTTPAHETTTTEPTEPVEPVETTPTTPVEPPPVTAPETSPSEHGGEDHGGGGGGGGGADD